MQTAGRKQGYRTYSGVIEDARLCPMPGAIPYIYLDLFVKEKNQLKTLQVNPQMLLNQLRDVLPYRTDILETINEIVDWLLRNIGKEITIEDYQGNPSSLPEHIEPEQFDPDNFEYR